MSISTAKEFVDIAVCSVTANADKDGNIERATGLVREAASRGAQWIFLPEMFAYHGPYDQLFSKAETEDGPLNLTLSQLAKDLNIVLFAGSVGERPFGATSGKVYNTQYVFGRTGQIIAKYRKTHLFNLKGQDGKPLYCESDGYMAGDALTTFQLDGWRIALATCYDLRFPEMFARLAQSEAIDLLAIPSAFTQQTGMYHWELLCRARAVEYLCYVAAANQVGLHSPGKTSYGHAVVIDPWGNILANTGNQTGVAVSRITKASIGHWRSQLPALTNRRPDIYK